MDLEERVSFPILSTERYLNAQQVAKDAVRKRIKEPQESDFKVTTVSHYPRWFIWGVVAALLMVMVASFIISAGKQVAASGLMFDHLPGTFTRLTADWANASVVSMLVLSELGAILFLVASGTIAHSAPMSTIRGHKVNITQWVLRSFAFVCAGYAILSKITITVLDPMDTVATWLQWAISIFMPCNGAGAWCADGTHSLFEELRTQQRTGSRPYFPGDGFSIRRAIQPPPKKP